MVHQISSKKQIWVFGDLRNIRLLRLSCNVLTKSRKLAADLYYDLIFILFEGETSYDRQGGYGEEAISAEEASEIAVKHGADYVLCFVNDAFILPQAHIIAYGLSESIKNYQPVLCLFAPTDLGREVAARTAAAGNMGVMADCSEIILEKGNLVGLCPTWGGTVIAKIAFAHNYKTGLATVLPHGKLSQPTKGQPGIRHYQPLDLPQLPMGLHLVAREVESDCQCRLEEAATVIAGGLGLSSPRGFEMLKNLAAVFGGELAATRPAVMNGWMPENRMLGQTGKRVRPRLLISVGTSGAVQYTAGIIESEFIVAINRDPNAPIFQVADVGIIADASGFLPLFIEKVKRKVTSNLTGQWCKNPEDKEAFSLGTFGEKLFKIRNSHQWSYEEVAEATGSSPEFLKKVEENILLPPMNFLLRLASIFDVSPDAFLNRQQRCGMCSENVIFKARQGQNNVSHAIETSAEHNRLRAFVIAIDPHQTYEPSVYKHAGEELIFVQYGILELSLGKEKYVIEAGGYRNFNSCAPHKLKSISSCLTQCLVVFYTT